MFDNSTINRQIKKEDLLETLKRMQNIDRLAPFFHVDRASQPNEIPKVYFKAPSGKQYNYYEILADLHPTIETIGYVNSEDRSTRRTVYENKYDAFLLSTTSTVKEPDSDKNHLSVSNNLVLPVDELIYQGPKNPKFVTSIKANKKDQSLIVRNLAISRIDTFSIYSHINNFDIFINPEERALAEKYFTYNQSNKIPTPHFHFNSSIQSQLLKTPHHANAIHLDSLINYLNDLYNAYINFADIITLNPHSAKIPAILKHKLNMPFLDIICGNMFIDAVGISDLDNLLNKNKYREFYNSLSFVKRKSKAGDGAKTIKTLIEDLLLYKELVKENSKDLEAVSLLTETINAIISTSIQNSLTYTDNNSI